MIALAELFESETSVCGDIIELNTALISAKEASIKCSRASVSGSSGLVVMSEHNRSQNEIHSTVF